MNEATVASTFEIRIGGRTVPDQVELSEVLVDQDAYAPDHFAVTYRDVEHDAVTVLGVRVGSVVDIAVITGDDPAPRPLLSGEVTALELDVDGATSRLTVRGYDQSHRLSRGGRAESYRNMTYDDVARAVARRAGLTPGAIDATGAPHEHITQGNESDWDFLNRLARQVGMNVAVADGKLHFRTPTDSARGPRPADMLADDPFSLVLGANVLRLEATVTAAGQVPEVEVRGWDVERKQAVSSVEPVATDRAAISVTPAELASTFRSPRLVSGVLPLTVEAATRTAARSLSDQVGQGFVELHGVARGTPRLAAGTAVSLNLAGPPFDGRYVLTRTRHRFDRVAGYTTEFSVARRDAQAPFREMMSSGGTAAGIAGVVIGIVDAVDDPAGQCRVRVRFPWMSDTYVSDWARTAQAGAGGGRGAAIVSEVGDEVLVAFEHGDVRRPVVVGGLYNGVDHPLALEVDLIDPTTHAVNARSFVSRSGHLLAFYDAPSTSGVVVATGDGSVTLKLDQTGRNLVVHCDGDITIDAGGSMALKTGGDLTAEVSGAFDVSAASVSLTGKSAVTVSGNPIRLN